MLPEGDRQPHGASDHRQHGNDATNDAASRMTRQEKDHERYLRQRETRLAKQRAYYQAHREQCRESVRRAQKRRENKLRTLFGFDAIETDRTKEL